MDWKQRLVPARKGPTYLRANGSLARVIRLGSYVRWLGGVLSLRTKDCTILYYTVMYCNILYCTVMYCTILSYTVLFCTGV
jgi:hypothetical protein